jgi:hypothetical protein
MLYDDFHLTYGNSTVNNPGGFDAAAFSTTQINQTWTLNANSDTVLVAQNSTNTFGTPTGTYPEGGAIAGGGTVLYKGTGTSSSHTGLTQNTKHYYKAWSKTASNQYSSGILDSATTYKIEPENYPLSFTNIATGITATTSWTDPSGNPLPDAYLVKMSNQDNITAPSDGTPVANDLDLTDGTGAINVSFGIGTYTFYKLVQNTTYYFKIYPYTNSGTHIDYKSDGAVPAGSATTQSLLSSNDFESNTFGTWTTYSVTSNKNWAVLTGTGALSTTHYGNMNGFGADVGSNDWLISPALNLDNYTSENILFFTSWNYSLVTDELKLMYSRDYTSGDPSLASWTEILFLKPTVAFTWLSPGFIDLSSITGDNVHVAFQYLSISTTDTRSWFVDEIEITGVGLSDPTNFNAATVSAGEIVLSWTKNSTSDDVMVAWNSTSTFGAPSGLYNEGDAIPGGGTVLYRGQQENFNHSGLFQATTFYYKAWSVDPSNNYSSGVTDNATTRFPEPTDHPTGFTAAANSPSTITVSWTDSDAGHYLIKGSSVDYGSIVAPVDGIGEADGPLVKNVNASVQTRQFTGLTPNTTYYFEIFPYNGTGESSNYKTDGTIPQASATTQGVNLNIYISEVSDPNDNSNTRFVELYNAGSTTIDFATSPVYLCKQANGGPTWNSVALTGTVPAGGTHVVAYIAAKYDSAYNSTANQYNSGVCNFNGDDGIFLYYGGNQLTGILFDAFGQINVLGDSTTTGWNYLDGHAVRKRGVATSNPVWTANEWVIRKKINTDNMTPKMHAADVTWQGTTSTNWNARGNNWSGIYGGVPDASCHVIIPNVTNYPIITRKSACFDVEIQSGSNLSIQSTGSLLIVGQ